MRTWTNEEVLALVNSLIDAVKGHGLYWLTPAWDGQGVSADQHNHNLGWNGCIEACLTSMSEKLRDHGIAIEWQEEPVEVGGKP